MIGMAMLAEGLSLPCPAVVALLMAGAAAAHGNLSVWRSAVVAAGSYTLGSMVPYYIGRNFHRLQDSPWIGSLVDSSLQALEQVKSLFQRHGDKVVAFSRPFWVGNFVSYFAGLYHMSITKFLLLTLLGTSVWTITTLYVGWLFSNNLPKAAAIMKRYSSLAFVLMVVVAVVIWWWRRRQQTISTIKD